MYLDWETNADTFSERLRAFCKGYLIPVPAIHYQRMISSLPEVGVRYEDKRLSGIPGSPPALLNPPEGCRFRARCPLADEQCRQEPPFVEIEPDHFVACWKVS